MRDLVQFVQFKKPENTHGRVLLLVTLQASTCNFTKSNILPWVSFTLLKLYKWYQIIQNVSSICPLRYAHIGKTHHFL